MTDELNALIHAAGRAANSGQWSEAERLWLDVLRLDPFNPAALYSLGVHAFQRRDLETAQQRLEAAHAASPSDPLVLLTLGIVRRERGDDAGEWQAITDALVADAYYLPALLARAAIHERRGQVKTAAIAYGHALRVAPQPAQWPTDLRPQLVRAKEIVDANAVAFQDVLDQSLAGPGANLEPENRGRWREAQAIKAGLSKPYASEANQLYVPRLPAIPFFEPSQFPWVADLEAQTDVIRDEFMAVLATQEDELTPYIAYRPGDPVNQWRELNHSRRWSTYQLWQGGAPVAEHLARCPRTAAALQAVEMASINGLCPNAMFSALAPHTEIPPHNGETNARLVVHLPLIVPEDCAYRVGFEHREWTVGKVLIFDDTIEHTARNDSDQLRVVLIFDVWNPLLTAAERTMVNAMAAATRAFYADA